MRLKRPKANLSSQFKSIIRESDLFQKPLKTIIYHFLNNLVFGTIALIAVLLLIPFSWRSISLEALSLLSAICLAKQFKNRKKLANVPIKWWTVASGMVFIVALCPFIITTKPVYIAVTDSTNPFTSKIFWLESEGSQNGSVLVFPHVDFVRIGISVVFKKLFPASFRILERTDYNDATYYRLPVFKGFTADSGGPSDFTWKRSIFFPCNPLERLININLVEPELLSPTPHQDNHINILFGTSVFGLVDFEYVPYPETIPWDCVRVAKGQESSVLVYVALLDQALECFVTGKTSEAIQELEAASDSIPESNLEAARVALLQYVAVNSSLGGNIGQVQSLPYLHRAYDLFLNSRKDPRFSQKDPLSNWLRDVLLDSYENWGWTTLFFDRTSELKSIPHVEEDDNQYYDNLGAKLERMSYAELLKSVQSSNYSSVTLFCMRNSVYKKFMFKWLNTMESYKSIDTYLDLDKDMAVDAQNAISVINTIDSQLTRHYGLRVDPLISGFIEYFASDLPKLERTHDEADLEKQLAVIAKQNPLLTDFVSSIKLFMNRPDEVTIKSLTNGRREGWYDNDYLRWFEFWGGNAIAEAYHHQYPSDQERPLPFTGPNTHELLATYGIECLTKDANGRGRTFLPGVFCMAWYAKEFGLNQFQDLTNEFETETLIPFETYQSSIFEPDNTETFNQQNQVLESYAKELQQEADIYGHVGETTNQIADYDLSINTIEQAVNQGRLELVPLLEQTLINRGLAFDASGQLTNAVSDYDQAIAVCYLVVTNGRPEVAFNLIRALCLRGNDHRRLGRFTMSVNDLTQAVKLVEPSVHNNPQAASDLVKMLVTRGFLYYSLRQDTNAEIDLRRAVSISQELYNNQRRTDLRADYERTLVILGLVLWTDERVNDARPYFQKAISLNADSIATSTATNLLNQTKAEESKTRSEILKSFQQIVH